MESRPRTNKRHPSTRSGYVEKGKEDNKNVENNIINNFTLLYVKTFKAVKSQVSFMFSQFCLLNILRNLVSKRK